MNAADIRGLDWQRIGAALDVEGHCLLPRFLSDEQVLAVRSACDIDPVNRAVDDPIERRRGSCRVLQSPMPPTLEALLPELYRNLLDIARLWQFTLDTPVPTLADLQAFADPDYTRRPEWRISSL